MAVSDFGAAAQGQHRHEENVFQEKHGPSPVITIAEQPGCLLVKFHGVQATASSRALVLLEANYPPVYYVPQEDIDEKYYVRTDHTSYCPYKMLNKF